MGVQELHKYGKKSYPQWLVQMIADGNKPPWLVRAGIFESVANCFFMAGD